MRQRPRPFDKFRTGFSLHARVRCATEDKQGLEQLCRHITRPAIANERLSVDRAGQVVPKLKTAWRDCTQSPFDGTDGAPYPAFSYRYAGAVCCDELHG